VGQRGSPLGRRRVEARAAEASQGSSQGGFEEPCVSDPDAPAELSHGDHLQPDQFFD
jgi:hypothetical protein